MADSARPRWVPPTSQDLELLIDSLARVAAAKRGLMGEQAIDYVEALKDRVAAVEGMARQRFEDAEARRRAAAELDKVIDLLGEIQSATGKALKQASPQIRAAVRGLDIHRMAEALRFVAEWLRDPTPEREADVMHLVERLKIITGAVDPATDPWADEATARELRANIESDVNKSLDDIFGDLSKLMD
jgi:hypothetical protein